MNIFYRAVWNSIFHFEKNRVKVGFSWKANGHIFAKTKKVFKIKTYKAWGPLHAAFALYHYQLRAQSKQYNYTVQ